MLRRRQQKGDERLIACPDQRLLVVVNFKCGFATMNRYLALSESVRTRNPVTLSRWRFGWPWQRVLFYRDPVERLISFYNNWIVGKSEQELLSRGKRNFYVELFRDCGREETYRWFREADPATKASDEAMARFLDCLPGFLDRDGHVMPQSWIYRRSGLTVEWFHRLLPMTETLNFLKERFGVKGRIHNRTGSNKLLQSINRDPVEAFCREHYAQDYKDLPL